MKRGKEDEKIMGPMFPRLHVNDTEKGGPRAPPRNKMALYEQLTIPSQSYNSGAMPLNPNNNRSLVSSTSTSQGTDRGRNMCFPLYQPPLAQSYPPDEVQARRPEAESLTNQLAQVEDIMKPAEEDDFMVPTLSQQRSGHRNGRSRNCIDEERCIHLSSNNPMALSSTGDSEKNQRNNGDFFSKQHLINQDARNLRVSDGPTRYSSDLMTREKDDIPEREDTSIQRGHQEQPRFSGLEKSDALSGQDHVDNSSYSEGALDEALENIHEEISLRPKHNPRIGCGYRGANDMDNGARTIEYNNLLVRENLDMGDDFSETSIVDSVSGLNISPDDVAGVFGEKHFWKARTAIVNQQRALAIQVFELHRLIKVQRCFAGSPHLLLEAGAFLGNSPLTYPTVKKHSSDCYAVNALSHTVEPKDNKQKPTDKMEGTAENAVAKAPVPFQHATNPTGYLTSPENPESALPDDTGMKMNPWSFHQPAPHQWLVPVMSPFEGLIYKPYTGSGFVGPPCVGCRPLGPVPNLHCYEGMGVPPDFPFGGHGYFPAYGTPMMIPDMAGSAMDPKNQCSVPIPNGMPITRPCMAGSAMVLMNQCSGPNPNGMPITRPGVAGSAMVPMNQCLVPNPNGMPITRPGMESSDMDPMNQCSVTNPNGMLLMRPGMAGSAFDPMNQCPMPNPYGMPTMRPGMAGSAMDPMKQCSLPYPYGTPITRPGMEGLAMDPMNQCSVPNPNGTPIRRPGMESSAMDPMNQCSVPDPNGMPITRPGIAGSTVDPMSQCSVPNPNGMPITPPGIAGSAMDPMNRCSVPNPYGQTGQPMGNSLNINLQQQGSCNMPRQKNKTTPATRALPPKGGLRGSPASGPGRAQSTAMSSLTGGVDAHIPLFPTAPSTKISEGVIRVVPHNRGSTRESAARIFQSIQEERRQYKF